MPAVPPRRMAAGVLGVLVLLASTPAGAVRTAAVGASAKVVDGRLDDWGGTSTMLGGTSVMSKGEFVYQDYLYDDLGAFVPSARNQSGLGGQAYHIGVRADGAEPLTWTGNLRGNSEKVGVGTFVYPDDEARYGNNAADIFQFRVAQVGDRIHFLVVLNTLLAADSTVIGLALGPPGSASIPWPREAGITTPGEHVVTVWGTGGLFDDRPLEAVGGQLAVSTRDNALEFSLPMSLIGTRFRAYLASGLWDTPNGRWMAIQQTRTTTAPGGSDGARPRIFNVAFRADEVAKFGDTGVYANNAWWERAQAAALAAGDIGGYYADIDLAAADTVPATRTGFYQRVYRSPTTIAPHEGVSWAGVLARNGMNSPAGRWTYHFLGPWLPYTIYIPAEYERMTVLLHGSGNTMLNGWQAGTQRGLGDTHRSILIDPLARGVHNGYAEYAELAVFDAMADVEEHYGVDPALTILGGGSMGGIGTYRLLALHPDKFAGAILWAGCAGHPGPHCTSTEESIELFRNYRNVEPYIHHGGLDPLILVNHAEQAAAELDDLGYAYEFRLFTFAGHTSFIEWDDYRLESAYVARQPRIDPNPVHVTYRTSEGWWSPEISPRLVYDNAYWVSGLRVRDTTLGDRAFGTVDAVTYGMGGTDTATQAIEPAYVQGPPNQHLHRGRARVAGPTLEAANRFTATLENLRFAAFDLSRMSLQTAAPLSATIATDGPAAVRLIGSGPVSVQGAPAVQDGQDVILRFEAAGTHEVTVRRGVQQGPTQR